MQDRFGNSLTAPSQEIAEQYSAAADSLIAGGSDMREQFRALVAAAPDCPLAHVGLARALQIWGALPEARAAMETARSLAPSANDRERSHIHCMGLLIDGKVPEAYPAIRTHVANFPTDVIPAQTCTSVFGLIGFSGKAGREAELLAYTTFLAPHYGDDWWFLSQHAFSFCETGQLDRADSLIEQSLARHSRNAHAAHVRSHIYYEAGDTAAGKSYLDNWLPDYDRSGLMHGHISWHVALWALETGDISAMWKIVDGNVAPGAALGVPLNVLTDTVAILFRAELVGLDVAQERWHAISTYAAEKFPKPGLAFADVHAAIAHAKAGNTAALNTILTTPAGPVQDLVPVLADAYRAVAEDDWQRVVDDLGSALADHARIGGSRAQRDMLDQTMILALMKTGKRDEAQRFYQMRRPIQAALHSLGGVAA